MACRIHARLNQEWSDATKEFSLAVEALTDHHIVTMLRSDYMVLVGAAEAARLHSENARIAVELHRKKHGC